MLGGLRPWADASELNTRLVARLELSLGDEDKLATLNEVELRKAAAVAPFFIGI